MKTPVSEQDVEKALLEVINLYKSNPQNALSEWQKKFNPTNEFFDKIKDELGKLVVIEQ